MWFGTYIHSAYAVLCCAYLISRVQPFVTPWTVCSMSGSSVHGDFPGKNTGVACHAHLQGIFSTQGSNPDLTHCKWILQHLSHQGSPYIHFIVRQFHLFYIK